MWHVSREMMQKKNSDNNRKKHSFSIAGFSLAELMVALAVSSIVSLGVMRINQNMTKTVTTAETDISYRQFVDGILKQKLTLKNNCRLNFAYDPVNLPANPTNVTIANPIATMNVLTGIDPTTNIAYSKSEDNNPVLNDMSANTAPFLTSVDQGGRQANLIAGHFVAGGDWKIKSMELQPFIANSVGSPVGTCPLEVVLRRNKGIRNEGQPNETRFFYGALEKTIRLDLSCKLKVNENGVQSYIESCRLAESDVENIWKQRYDAGMDGFGDVENGAYIYYDEKPGLGGYVTIGPRLGGTIEQTSSPLEIYSDAAVWMFPVFSQSVMIPVDSVYTFINGTWGMTELKTSPGSCLTFNKWEDSTPAVFSYVRHCQEQEGLPASDTAAWPQKIGFSSYKKGIRFQRGDLNIMNGNLNIGSYVGGQYSNKMEIPGAGPKLGYSRANEVITNSYAIGTGNTVYRPNSGAVGGNNDIRRKFSHAFGISNYIAEFGKDTVTPNAVNEPQMSTFSLGLNTSTIAQRAITIGANIDNYKHNSFSIGFNISDKYIAPYSATSTNPMLLPTWPGTGSLSTAVSTGAVTQGTDYIVGNDNLNLIYRANKIGATNYQVGHANPAGGRFNENPNPAYSIVGYNYNLGDDITYYPGAYSTFALGKDLNIFGSHRSAIVMGRGLTLGDSSTPKRDIMMLGYLGATVYPNLMSVAPTTLTTYPTISEDKYIAYFANEAIRFANYGNDASVANAYRNSMRILKGGSIEQGDVAAKSETDPSKRNDITTWQDMFASSISAFNSDIYQPYSSVFGGQDNIINYKVNSGITQVAGNAILGAGGNTINCFQSAGMLSTYNGTLSCRDGSSATNPGGEANVIIGGGYQTMVGAERFNIIAGGGYNSIENTAASYDYDAYPMVQNAILGGYENRIEMLASTPLRNRAYRNNVILGSRKGRIAESQNKESYHHHRGGNLILSSDASTSISIGHSTNSSIINSYDSDIWYNMSSSVINSRDSSTSRNPSISYSSTQKTSNNVIIGGYKTYIRPGNANTPNNGGRNVVIGSNANLTYTNGGESTKGNVVLTNWFEPAASVTNYVFPPVNQVSDYRMYARFNNYNFFTDAANGNGIFLLASQTSWSSSSSKALKENFKNLDDEIMIQKILNLDIKRWSYKGDFDINLEGDRRTYISPFSEDFYASYGLGYDNKNIEYGDMAGVAAKTLQALHKGMQELEEELEYQKTILGKIHSFIAKIRVKINGFVERRRKNKARVEKLKRALANIKKENAAIKESLKTQ